MSANEAALAAELVARHGVTSVAAARSSWVQQARASSGLIVNGRLRRAGNSVLVVHVFGPHVWNSGWP